MRFTIQNQNETQFLLPELLVSKDTPNQQTFQSIYKIATLLPQKLNEEFQYSQELQQHLQGKRLLLDELPFPLSDIHQHYLNGYIQYHHGIITNPKKQFICQRCGNQNQHIFASFHCARCREQGCTYCRNCIMMGRVSQCTPLITWTGPSSQKTAHIKSVLNWSGQLSPGQQTASDKVIETINNNQDLLVWAVCGSGKTEVLFQGIKTALQHGKQVCITTPRTDVVHELTPRLKQAFPNTTLISLYGGSEDRSKTAQLTISTTHQLLRYYKNFDVIIIDEVDAFPYSADPSLQYAVHQAKKEISAMIYLTATPNAEFKQKSNKNKIQTVTIPARYHRQPLPVPTFTWCGNWKSRLKKKHAIPTNLKNWITGQFQNNKQAFLFVPHITTLNDVVPILKKINASIEGVHSEDPNRKQKVQAFREGTVPILVTTTILERGVTVPNTDVAVFGAEDDIFTESALVQIAGRVGRSPKYPAGEVIFFHYGKTKAMKDARTQILKMNKQGKHLGLLD
ncbi:DEAD/DEAH box helicase [Schinkia azotoformans]|nr:DEAD/DEAH box helicase [Schinkia azotoformans]MEC1637568.1 DEAD/DEAH box helicase [Schinkia azotoformans]MEC1943972.1 DEAD/DEAH box helicase [Schinkia azotoformans]